MMLTHDLFYAKTLVAQVKAAKRFNYDEDCINNALDTLNQAQDKGVATKQEVKAAINMISDYLFNMRIPSVFMQ